MIVGVPKEIKDNEYRVAAPPASVEALVLAGHQVLVERGAGIGSGFSDEEYLRAGAQLLATPAEVFARAEMIWKVKEPIRPEYDLLREGLLLFTFFHLAAEEELTHTLMDKRVTSIAYETVELPNGDLPMLTPMSEVAGRMAIQVAAHYLEKMNGGRGVLLGGVPGVKPAEVAVIGGGVVGTHAAQMALGLGARVTIINRGLDRLRYLNDVLHGNFITLSSNPRNIAEAVQAADVVVGGVLITGAKAPRLVTREMVQSMRPGSVVVDVSIDQGGCVETAHPTTHSNPIYLVDGVIHYCVTNMPGAVPRTSTFALNNTTLPYALKLANLGFLKAVQSDPALAKGVNTYAGYVTHPAVASAFGLEYRPLPSLL